jgi:hypothetical protein
MDQLTTSDKTAFKTAFKEKVFGIGEFDNFDIDETWTLSESLGSAKEVTKRFLVGNVLECVFRESGFETRKEFWKKEFRAKDGGCLKLFKVVMGQNSIKFGKYNVHYGLGLLDDVLKLRPMKLRTKSGKKSTFAQYITDFKKGQFRGKKTKRFSKSGAKRSTKRDAERDTKRDTKRDAERDPERDAVRDAKYNATWLDETS